MKNIKYILIYFLVVSCSLNDGIYTLTNAVKMRWQNSTSSDIITRFKSHDIIMSINYDLNATYTILSNENFGELTLKVNVSNTDVIHVIEDINIALEIGERNYNLPISPIKNGLSLITMDGTAAGSVDVSEAFVRVSVYRSLFLIYVSEVIGWIYFAAWSISFYPQIIMNFKRKSVVGLHFDFLALNTIGFLMYSAFNIGFYYIPKIEKEYFKRHPHGVNPVQLNDVVFSIHAFFACIILVYQCLNYEKGNQKISRTGKSFIGSFSIGSIIMLILGASSVISWIDFLYFVSYVKLFITLIKYIPQAYYNYLRKSTVGWSIGNILLDFTGGILSIFQMFVIAYNFDDWSSIFGDLTKFGLGLFSVLFDIFFIIQHYVLYKDRNQFFPIPSSSTLSEESQESLNSRRSASYGAITS